ncbi:MAG TPA: DUF58 domain-containing protein [Candidatus Methylacidiphilales bacterium]|nr:DUF58 domain-containing protein [Candidatus Methylacidiphilales bacterium]
MLAIHTRMQALAGQLRLPLRGRVWRGQNGNWLGAGTGSSIDFQDHRPYIAGDDPRYIDWQAYARTGHYSMKLYREEVSPRVDVALDLSDSMALTPEKERRSIELFYFAVESALRTGASLNAFLILGEQVWRRTSEELMGHRWQPTAEAVAKGSGAASGKNTATVKVSAYPKLGSIPWRQGALRVFVSDLLYPGAPDPAVKALVAAKGRCVIYAPAAIEEGDPDWSGNIKFTDCESDATRDQRVDAGLLERYRQTYQRHFALWQETCRRYDALIARVPAEGPLLAALQSDALAQGAVEMLN